MSKVNKNKSSEQTIEELKLRYEKLNRRKIESETNLANSKKQLEQLRAEAREKYGSDDLEELKNKLEEMKADNLKKRLDYQSGLDKIESDLAKVDAEYQTASGNNPRNQDEDS